MHNKELTLELITKVVDLELKQVKQINTEALFKSSNGGQ